MRIRDAILEIAAPRVNTFAPLTQLAMNASIEALGLGGNPAGLELHATGGAYGGATGADTLEERATRGLWRAS